MAPWTFFFATPGPATSANFATSSSAWSSSARKSRIEPHHLPPELFRGVAESPQQPYNTLHEARSAYEREFILRKLQEHRWNMTQTAAALGLERSHLYRKMKSLGIAAPE